MNAEADNSMETADESQNDEVRTEQDLEPIALDAVIPMDLNGAFGV